MYTHALTIILGINLCSIFKEKLNNFSASKTYTGVTQ